MHEMAASFPGSVVSLETEPSSEIAREFEARLADCSALAFRVALGVLRNREDAEDVAQEAFLRAYQNFHRLRERASFRSWLTRIVWRLAIDRWRTAGRREAHSLHEDAGAACEAGAPSVEAIVASREFRQHLDRAMDELPEKLRLVLVLAAIEGHNMAEVASMLGLPEGTVKSRLHLARKQLAEKLKWLVSNTKKT